MQRLETAGVDTSRPVSAVFNATRPSEQIVAGTLATIQCQIEGLKGKGPCILLVGARLPAELEVAAGQDGSAARMSPTALLSLSP